MNDQLTILGVSDYSYLPFIRTLFNSIKCNVKIPYKFHLYAINVPDKKIDFFKNNYENIEFTRDNIELDDTTNKINPFGKSRKASYCANIRANIIYDLMCKGTQYILYLDADSIVRKDLNDLFLLIKQTDFIIFRRDKETDVRVKVLTSVVGINNTPNSLKFMSYWKDYMLIPKNLYSWYSDQKYFYKAMTKLPDVKIQELPISYVDSSFLEKSFIWNGKGNRKHKHNIYIKEMEKYK